MTTFFCGREDYADISVHVLHVGAGTVVVFRSRIISDTLFCRVSWLENKPCFFSGLLVEVASERALCSAPIVNASPFGSLSASCANERTMNGEWACKATTIESVVAIKLIQEVNLGFIRSTILDGKAKNH